MANKRDNREAYRALEESIQQAKHVCGMQDVDEVECVIAWDTVDEIMRGIHHREEKEETDPLEAYCHEVEEADECRLYDV